MSKDKQDEFQWRSVEVCNFISQEFFEQHFLNKMAPVIITNSVPKWAALKNWTPDYLKQKLGKKTVLTNVGYFQILNNEGDIYPFNNLMKIIEDSSEDEPAPYLRNFDIYTYLPELVDDIKPRLGYALPNWLTCKLIPKIVTDGLVELFIGGKGTAFPILHFDSDGSNAFITQIYGEKEVFLFSPDQTEPLRTIFGKPGNFSLEKLENEISAKKPAALQLIGFKQTLSPGDTVFIPAGWWHTTFMKEISISVSTNNVNNSNWRAFVESSTDYNKGVKKVLKVIYLTFLGKLLLALDLVGQSKLISRPLD